MKEKARVNLITRETGVMRSSRVCLDLFVARPSHIAPEWGSTLYSCRQPFTQYSIYLCSKFYVLLDNKLTHKQAPTDIEIIFHTKTPR